MRKKAFQSPSTTTTSTKTFSSSKNFIPPNSQTTLTAVNQQQNNDNDSAVSKTDLMVTPIIHEASSTTINSIMTLCMKLLEGVSSGISIDMTNKWATPGKVSQRELKKMVNLAVISSILMKQKFFIMGEKNIITNNIKEAKRGDIVYICHIENHLQLTNNVKWTLNGNHTTQVIVEKVMEIISKATFVVKNGQISISFKDINDVECSTIIKRINKNLEYNIKNNAKKPGKTNNNQNTSHLFNNDNGSIVNILSLNTTSLSKKRLDNIIYWAYNNDIRVINLQEIYPSSCSGNLPRITKHNKMIKENDIVKKYCTLYTTRGYNDRGLITMVIKRNDDDENESTTSSELISTDNSHVCTKIMVGTLEFLMINTYLNPNHKKQGINEVKNKVTSLIEEHPTIPIILMGDFNLQKVQLLDNFIGKINIPSTYTTNIYNQEDIPTFNKRINNSPLPISPNLEQNNEIHIENATPKNNCIDHTIIFSPNNMISSYFIPENTNYIPNLNTQHSPLFLSLNTIKPHIEQYENLPKQHVKMKCVVKHLPNAPYDITGDIKNMLISYKKTVNNFRFVKFKRKVIQNSTKIANDVMWTELYDDMQLESIETMHENDIETLFMKGYKTIFEVVNKSVPTNVKGQSKKNTSPQQQQSSSSPPPTPSPNNNNYYDTNKRWERRLKRIRLLLHYIINKTIKLRGISDLHAAKGITMLKNTLMLAYKTHKDNELKDTQNKVLQDSTKLSLQGLQKEAFKLISDIDSNGSISSNNKTVKMKMKINLLDENGKTAKRSKQVAEVYSSYLNKKENENDGKRFAVEYDRDDLDRLERVIKNLKYNMDIVQKEFKKIGKDFETNIYCKEADKGYSREMYDSVQHIVRKFGSIKYENEGWHAKWAANVIVNRRHLLNSSWQGYPLSMVKKNFNWYVPDYLTNTLTKNGRDELDGKKKMIERMKELEKKRAKLRDQYEEFNTMLQKKYGHNTYIDPSYYHQNKIDLTEAGIHIEEVAEALVGMDNFRAVGGDFIIAEILKAAVTRKEFKPEEEIILNHDDNEENVKKDDEGKRCITMVGYNVKSNTSRYNTDTGYLNRPQNPYIIRATSDFEQPSPMLRVLHKMLQIVYNTAYIPKIWRLNIISMLYKKGDKTAPGNYRPVSISAIMQKLLNKIITKRLQIINNTLKDKVNEHGEGNGYKTLYGRNQIAYTPCRSRFEHIISLMEYNNKMMNGNIPGTKVKKKVYNIFVDLSRAFDSVNHKKLSHILRVKMGKMGQDSKFIDYVENMYKNIYYTSRNNGKYAELKRQRWGIKQGDNMSPILFNIYFDLVLDGLNKLLKQLRPPNEDLAGNWPHNNIFYDYDPILSLAYADDLVISTTNPKWVPIIMQELHLQLDKLDLELNVKKTEMLVVSKERSKGDAEKHNVMWTTRCTNEVHVLKSVDEYRYLGAYLNRSGDINIKVNELLGPLFEQSKIFFGHNTSQQLKIKVFNTYVMPKLLGNAAALGVAMHKSADMNKSVKNDVIGQAIRIIEKIILKNSDTTTLQAVTRTVNWDTNGIQDPREQLQQQASKIILELCCREKYNVNEWLHQHIHNMEIYGGAGYDAPMIKLLRKMYNDLKCVTVIGKTHEKNERNVGYKLDLSPFMHPMAINIIKQKELYIIHDEAEEHDKKQQDKSESTIEIMNTTPVLCTNLRLVKRITGVPNPFPIKKRKSSKGSYHHDNVIWILSNKKVLDEIFIGNRVSTRDYLLRGGYESNKVTRNLRTMLPWYEKELLTIQEMRTGKRKGKIFADVATGNGFKKSFIMQECPHCMNNQENNLYHQIIECPSTNLAIKLAINEIKKFEQQNKLNIDGLIRESYEIERRAAKHRIILLNRYQDIPIRAMKILSHKNYKNKARYELDIDQLNRHINMPYINTIILHQPKKWETHREKIRSLIDKNVRFILDDDFIQLQRLNIHLIEMISLKTIWHRNPHTMMNNLLTNIANHDKLHEKLISPKGGYVQQTIMTMLLVFILKYKRIMQ